MNFGQWFTTVYTLLHRDLARNDLIIIISFCIVLNRCINIWKYLRYIHILSNITIVIEHDDNFDKSFLNFLPYD